MDTVLELERKIDELPKEEFGVLAVWFLERAEQEGLLDACRNAEQGGLAEDAEADSVISKLRLRAGSQMKPSPGKATGTFRRNDHGFAFAGWP